MPVVSPPVPHINIIEMASSEGRRNLPAMSLRSSRRLQPPSPPSPAPLSPPPRGPPPPTQNEDAPKVDKDSLTYPPEPLLPPQTASRRITRSNAHLFPLVVPVAAPMTVSPVQQSITPFNDLPSKHSQEATCQKHMKRADSSQPDLKGPETVKKQPTATTSTFEPIQAEQEQPKQQSIQKGQQPAHRQQTMYGQIRKSYRKCQRRKIVSIPYRKCHDIFQGRIVAIINKIQSGKNCLRELENLIERMGRINAKDLMNRYIIAGIKTILRLTQHQTYHQCVYQRLKVEEDRLRKKIVEEMDRTEDLPWSLVKSNQSVVDCRHYRIGLTRKIYKLLKLRQRHQPDCARIKEQAVSDCAKFLGCETNINSLIQFVKHNIQQLH